MSALVCAVKKLSDLDLSVPISLPDAHNCSATWHQWSQAEIDALRLAYAAGRPLLVRGEPGTGKTQLARAAAQALGWMLHAETIHPRFEPHELRYRFDAVRRLADAQAQKTLDDTCYWQPGVLWRAYGWEKAEAYLPEAEKNQHPTGHVVLIDEIDKADSDLPNSLLEVLGQRRFSIPALGLEIGGGASGKDRPQPLVIITTNEERELPAAFLRRCVVLSLAPDADYREWLIQRGQAHFGALPGVPGREQPLLAPELLAEAARQLVADRDAVGSLGLSRPGLAEYLDLLYALHTLIPPNEAQFDAEARTREQQTWLKRLSAYSFLKHPVDDGSSLAHQPTQARARREDAAGQEPR
ncbi:MAG: MoxR family ATPase [Rhodocyclales bacterium]|nr:MoxR family ATPase [Rhodocyclales bacterium]